MEIRKSCRPGENYVRAVPRNGQRRNRRSGGVSVNVRLAGAFAERVRKEAGPDPEKQIEHELNQRALESGMKPTGNLKYRLIFVALFGLALSASAGGAGVDLRPESDTAGTIYARL